MKHGIFKKIILLSTVLLVAGCGSVPTQPATAEDAILTGEELESMIQVTVTQIVAARD